MFKLKKCPKCGGKPVKMVYQDAKNKNKREYGYICCDLNTGHIETEEGAKASWNHLVFMHEKEKTEGMNDGR